MERLDYLMFNPPRRMPSERIRKCSNTPSAASPLLIAAAFASEWIYAADAEQVQLEEVVVTGERTNRSGFETATSNRVFSTPNIDRSGHNLSATDLLKQTVNTVDLAAATIYRPLRGVDGSGPAVGAVAFLRARGRA